VRTRNNDDDREEIMEQSESIGELTKALIEVQKHLVNPSKTSSGYKDQYRYADLATVWEAIRGPLSDNGLAVIQTTDVADITSIIVVTTLSHTSGEWIRGRLAMATTTMLKGEAIPTLTPDPQAYGSSLSYARRYGLMAIVGISPEEDDGVKGSGRGNAKAKAKPKSKPAEERKPGDTFDPVKAHDAIMNLVAKRKIEHRFPDFGTVASSAVLDDKMKVKVDDYKKMSRENAELLYHYVDNWGRDDD
jgi:hypothetical protein